MSTWIPLKTAREIMTGAGHEMTNAGVVYIASRGGFIRKSADGHHWEFDQTKLRRWIELKKHMTLTHMIKMTGKNSQAIYDAMRDLGIKYHESLGLKFYGDEDVQRIIKYCSERHKKQAAAETN